MSKSKRPAATPDLFDPLGDDELDWLDTFLLERVDEDAWREGMDEGVFEISGLDGLFTAIVSGPVALPPSRWLPTVWGDFEPANTRDLEHALTLMIRHMNAIAAHLIEAPESFEPLFLERTVEDKTFTIVDEWCEGYRRGAELAEAEWQAGGAEIMTLLEPIYAFTEDGEWGAHEQGLDQVEALQRAIAPSARAIHAYWLARRGDFEGERRSPIRRAEPRIGRNDPCPCGSGKKYKKCCLQ
jgi:uncharacterized protein